MKVLFFLRRIGPYHHARFEAAAKVIELVAVETRSGSREYPWEFDPHGTYKNIKFPSSPDPEVGIRGDQLKDFVTGILEKERPNVVVTTGWADPEYHVVALLSRERKIPLVIISDSRYKDEPRRFHKEFIKRLILRSYSAALIAGTESREYLKYLGFDPKSMFQPWDVVDNAHFSRADVDIAFGQRKFLCVARFIQKKNVEGLIKAFSLYVESGGQRRLQLVGSGELESTLRQTVHASNVADKVDFTDFLQYDPLAKVFRAGFSLILPSFSDQWGLVVNEAMAAGLPVLVSRECGCAADLVQEPHNGFIFDPFSTEDIARALRSADVKEPEWQKMSTRSTEIIAKWTVDAFAKGLKDACVHAIAHPRSFTFPWIHKMLSL